MFDFYEKRKIRSLVYSKMAIGFILVLAVLLGFSTYERFVVEREMNARKEEKEAELQVLKERAAALEEKVEHLENERGIEEELRSRFDVAKEGEQVIVILGEQGSENTDLDALSSPPGSNGATDSDSLFDLFKFWRWGGS